MGQGACGSPFDCVAKTGRAALWNYHAGCAGGKRSADDRAQIVRIFHTVEQHEETVPTLIVKQIVKPKNRFGRSKRDYSLMFCRANQTIELLAFLEAN
jgi:hypothetical protein